MPALKAFLHEHQVVFPGIATSRIPRRGGLCKLRCLEQGAYQTDPCAHCGVYVAVSVLRLAHAADEAFPRSCTWTCALNFRSCFDASHVHERGKASSTCTAPALHNREEQTKEARRRRHHVRASLVTHSHSPTHRLAPRRRRRPPPACHGTWRRSVAALNLRPPGLNTRTLSLSEKCCLRQATAVLASEAAHVHYPTAESDQCLDKQ